MSVVLFVSPHAMRRCDATNLSRLLAAAVSATLLGGCALSSTAQARFTPTSGDRGAGFTTELVRSCELDDCRTQAVRLTLPDGEVLSGRLRLLTAGPMVADAVAASQDRRPATMSLVGDRGSRLQCELLFSAGARNARGVCKASGGAAYSVAF